MVNGVQVTLLPNQMNEVDIEITDSIGNSISQTISIFQGYPEKGEFFKISNGGRFSCGIGVVNGHVKCWGVNDRNQLGYGSADASFGQKLPADMPAMDFGERAIDIYTGLFHACVVLESGSVKCWGGNSRGQLGYGDKVDRTDTAAVNMPNLNLPAGTSVTNMYLRFGASCALLDNQSVVCWGQDNAYYSHLTSDNSTSEIIEEPANASIISDPNGIKDFAKKGSTSCYVNGIGDLYCWGNNFDSQTGIVGAGSSVLTPTQVDMNGESVSSVDSGNNNTCAVLESGNLKCWGAENYLGFDEVIGDDETPGSMPVITAPRGNITNVYVNKGFCAETDLMEVFCIGQNYSSGLSTPATYAGLKSMNIKLHNSSKIPNKSFSNYMGLSSGFVVAGSDYSHISKCLKNKSNGDIYCMGGTASFSGYTLGNGNITTGTRVKDLPPLKFYSSFSPAFMPPEVVLSNATSSIHGTSTQNTSVNFSINEFPRSLSYEVLSHNVSSGSALGNEEDLKNGITVDLVPNSLNKIIVKITNASGQEETLSVSVFQGTEPQVASSTQGRETFYLDPSTPTVVNNLASTGSDYTVVNNLATINNNLYSQIADDNTVESVGTSDLLGGKTEAESKLDTFVSVSANLSQGSLDLCSTYVYELRNFSCNTNSVNFEIDMNLFEGNTATTEIPLLTNGGFELDIPINTKRIIKFSDNVSTSGEKYFDNGWFYFSGANYTVRRYNKDTNETEIIIDGGGAKKMAGGYIYTSINGALYEYEIETHTIRKVLDLYNTSGVKLLFVFGQNKLAISASTPETPYASLFVMEQGSGLIEKIGDSNSARHINSFRNVDGIGFAYHGENTSGSDSIFIYNIASNTIDRIYDFNFDNVTAQMLGVVDSILTFADSHNSCGFSCGDAVLYNFYIDSNTYQRLYSEDVLGDFYSNDYTTKASNYGYFYDHEGKTSHLYIDSTTIDRSFVFEEADKRVALGQSDAGFHNGDKIIAFITIDDITNAENINIFNYETKITTRLTNFSSPTDLLWVYMRNGFVYFTSAYDGSTRKLSKIDLDTGEVESAFLNLQINPGPRDNSFMFVDGVIFVGNYMIEQ